MSHTNAKPGAPIDNKKHDFWATQPVPQITASAEVQAQIKRHKLTVKDFNGSPIETKTVEEVPKEPYPVASILEWGVLDINDTKQFDELHTMLYENYVEDPDELFRFNYSKPFLRWALAPPGYFPEWHVCVRKKDTKELMAFIAGVPMNLRLGETKVKVCEINFLCLSRRLRDKRLSPILIKEVTRRVNLKNVWQAIYTAGRDFPTPISTCLYYHRSINPEKLVDIGFSNIPDKYNAFKKPMEALKKAVALDTKSNRVPNLRKMKKEDIPAVYELLKKQLSQSCAVAIDFDVEELTHWLITPEKDDIVHGFVREDPETKVVTDFFSFYTLNSSVLKHPKYDTCNCGYLYYYAATTVPITTLIHEALIQGQILKYDVFNCLDIMQNEQFIQDPSLRFNKGSGKLRYYLFNWKLDTLQCGPEHIGVVML